MKLTFASAKQLSQVWRQDFLGLQGFLLPGEQSLQLGQELEVTLLVNEQHWGSGRAKVIWQNVYAQDSELTPKGTFLALTVTDSKLQKQLGIN